MSSFVKRSATSLALALMPLTAAAATHDSPPERSHHLSLGAGILGSGADSGARFMVNSPYFAANQLSLQLAATEYRLAAGRESSYEVGLVGSTWLTPALRGSWINTLGYGTDRSIVSRSTLGLEYFSSPSARLTFSGEAGLGQSVRTDTFDPGTGQSDRGAIGNGAFVQIALRWYPY